MTDRRIYIEEKASGFADEMETRRGDGLFHYRSETVNVGGVFYRRSASASGQRPTPPTSHWRRGESQHDNASEDAPEVLCGKCFGQAFTLYYGSYEISARCIECGHEDEVYSG